MALSREQFIEYLQNTYPKGELSENGGFKYFKILTKDIVANTFLKGKFKNFRDKWTECKVWIKFLKNTYELHLNAENTNNKFFTSEETKKIFNISKRFKFSNYDERREFEKFLVLKLGSPFENCRLEASKFYNEFYASGDHYSILNKYLDESNDWEYSIYKSFTGTYSIKGFDSNMHIVEYFLKPSTWESYVNKIKEVIFNLNKKNLTSLTRFNSTHYKGIDEVSYSKIEYMPEKEKEEFGDWLLENCRESLIKCSDYNLKPLVEDKKFREKIQGYERFWKAYVYFKEELNIDLFEAINNKLHSFSFNGDITIMYGVRGQSEILLPKELFSLSDKVTLQVQPSCNGLNIRIEDGATSFGNIFIEPRNSSVNVFVHIPTSIKGLVDLKQLTNCFLVFPASEEQSIESSFQITELQKEIYWDKTVQEKI